MVAIQALILLSNQSVMIMIELADIQMAITFLPIDLYLIQIRFD